MDPKAIKDLLDKYLQGSCSAAETKQLEEWLNEIDSRDNEWTQMRPVKQKRYLKALYREIAVLTVGHSNNYHVVKLAAACLATLAVLSVVLYSQFPTVRDMFRPVHYLTVSTGVGETSSFVLPDSSRVWLNARARLRYPDKFRGQLREVFLEGEAFFNVAPDKSHPFTIHSGELETLVLGTQFNIHAYPGDDNVQVAVVSGKVEVSVMDSAGGHNAKAVLSANQLGNYRRSTMQLTTMPIKNVTEFSSWRDGILAFHQSTMEDVIHALERAYRLRITLSNPAIASCRITGRFDARQPPKYVIESICLSVGAKYKIEGENVIISGPGCS